MSALPKLEPVWDVASNLVDNPGRLHSWHIGRRISLLLFGARAVADQDVGRVDSCCTDAEPHLPPTGVIFGQFDDLQNFRTALSEVPNCAHNFFLQITESLKASPFSK
jgi:hypothetical protein